MIPNDKTQHSTWGNLVMLFFLPIVYITLKVFNIESIESTILIALLIVFIVGIGKEIYDRQHPEKHTADIWDALATGYQPTIYVIYFLLWRLYG